MEKHIAAMMCLDNEGCSNHSHSTMLVFSSILFHQLEMMLTLDLNFNHCNRMSQIPRNWFIAKFSMNVIISSQFATSCKHFSGFSVTVAWNKHFSGFSVSLVPRPSPCKQSGTGHVQWPGTSSSVASQLAPIVSLNLQPVKKTKLDGVS